MPDLLHCCGRGRAQLHALQEVERRVEEQPSREGRRLRQTRQRAGALHGGRILWRAPGALDGDAGAAVRRWTRAHATDGRAATDGYPCANADVIRRAASGGDVLQSAAAGGPGDDDGDAPRHVRPIPSLRWWTIILCGPHLTRAMWKKTTLVGNYGVCLDSGDNHDDEGRHVLRSWRLGSAMTPASSRTNWLN